MRIRAKLRYHNDNITMPWNSRESHVTARPCHMLCGPPAAVKWLFSLNFQPDIAYTAGLVM